MGKNREIGFKNQLLWSIPEDMKHFKNYTMGKTIVMGSNTFSSLNSKPLPGRKNVVITSKDLHCTVAIHAKNVESALSIEHCYPELVIIGGASIYAQTIDLADKLVITHVDAAFDADTFFPRIDLTKWQLSNIILQHNKEFKYEFAEYVRC